jgi:hypothetical protein
VTAQDGRRSYDDVQRDIERGAVAAESLSQRSEASERAQSRRTIGNWVIGVYAFSIVAKIAYIAVDRGVLLAENVTGDLLEIIKVADVPIVTLAFGYDFGSAR